MTKKKNEPLVSVIVTTKNEEKNIENFCKSVVEQSYKNIELILVDNNSTDKTKEIALKYTDKVFNKGPERSTQRNYGVKKSKGDYILVLDADMILTQNVVKECVEFVTKNSEHKALVIPEKSIGTSFWAKCKAFERSFYFLDNVDNGIEAARFFEKKSFNELGGYDINITGPEDWDLPERIYKKYPKKHKVENHLIHNENDIGLLGLAKKKFYYAKKSNVYLKKHNISVVSTKTIYFLRPVFYKHYREWFKNPILSIGTIIMLTVEFIAGALGYLIGIKK